MPLPAWLFEMLACPQCRGPVNLTDGESALVCMACALSYPIRDEIPVMLVSEATRTGPRTLDRREDRT